MPGRGSASDAWGILRVQMGPIRSGTSARHVSLYSQQSGYNKRIRAAFGLIQTTVVALTKDTDTWHEVLRFLEATPIPCGRSRQTAQRSGLAGHARYGFTAAHREYFWGMRLVLISTPDGMPVIWGVRQSQTGRTRHHPNPAGWQPPLTTSWSGNPG